MKFLRIACALVLAFLPTGCIVAIGNRGNDELEERIERIEEQLGIEPAEEELHIEAVEEPGE